MKSLITKASFFCATVANVGYLPGAPGTYASAITVFLYYLLARRGYLLSDRVAGILLLAGFFFAVIVSDRVSKTAGNHDPSFVVIDEVIGQWVALFLIPEKVWTLCVAFLLFRLFDILKPFPIRRLESFSGGWGIVLDDVGAGFYANIILQLVTRLVL